MAEPEAQTYQRFLASHRRHKAVMGKKYFRAKRCRFCVDKIIDDINYKDVRLLHLHFQRGKITPWRISGVCATASAAAGGSHQAGTQHCADPVCDVDVRGPRHGSHFKRRNRKPGPARRCGESRPWLRVIFCCQATGGGGERIQQEDRGAGKEACLRRESKEIGDANDSLMMGLVEVTIAQKAGENHQLFGSVTAQDITAALERAGYTIDRKKVNLAEPIKALGDYKVTVKPHREVFWWSCRCT